MDLEPDGDLTQPRINSTKRLQQKIDTLKTKKGKVTINDTLLEQINEKASRFLLGYQLMKFSK